MNILYYNEQRPQPFFGGVSNVAYHLMKALAKKINVTYYPRFMSEKDIVVKFLRVYQRLTAKEFSIVHFNLVPLWVDGSSLLLRLAKLWRVPTVLNIHGVIQLEHRFRYNQPDSTRYSGLTNTLTSCRTVDRIVVNSEYMRANVAAWYGVDNDKITVIPNGIDLEKFSKCDNSSRLDGDPAILYLGLLSRMKGIDILIKALALVQSDLPNVQLHLVGHGHAEGYRLLAKEYNVEKSVIFHGFAPHSTVPHYYKAADLCVVPSRHEGFGITVLEAMASGTPLIASDIGGIPELVSHGKNGLLFKVGDAEDLSKAIVTLYEDIDLRKSISGNALKTAEQYSWENIAEKYISLYKVLHEQQNLAYNRP